uniref:Uncharacterized protein n=1 Tax=Macrostomum lignano TaxID=282301 RepID=A0A1I8G9W2_9PLAT
MLYLSSDRIQHRRRSRGVCLLPGNHVNGSPFTVYARSADPLSQLNDLRLLDEGLGSANIDKLRQLRSKLALLSWGRDDTSDFGYGESSCSNDWSTSTGRKQQQQKQWKQFGPTGVANDRMLSQSRNKTLSAQAGTNSSQPQQQRRTMGLVQVVRRSPSPYKSEAATTSFCLSDASAVFQEQERLRKIDFVPVEVSCGHKLDVQVQEQQQQQQPEHSQRALENKKQPEICIVTQIHQKPKIWKPPQGQQEPEIFRPPQARGSTRARNSEASSSSRSTRAGNLETSKLKIKRAGNLRLPSSRSTRAGNLEASFKLKINKSRKFEASSSSRVNKSRNFGGLLKLKVNKSRKFGDSPSSRSTRAGNLEASSSSRSTRVGNFEASSSSRSTRAGI